MSKNQTTLVSIAMTTYNCEAFLGSAIKSILDQTYPNIEIIISDDASTDATVKIAQNIANQHPDKIKILTSEKNQGANENWFKCTGACSGKYVLGLAGDDELLPNVIEDQIKILENDPNIAICYADAVVFDVMNQKKLYNLSDKTPTKSGGLKIALQDSIYYSPTSMFRRSLMPEKNIFKDLRHGTDLAFYKEIMIIAGSSARIQYLPEVLYKYQKHDSNITVTQKEYRKDHIEAIKILQKKYPKYREYLNSSIYDFCCVAFFKSMINYRYKDAYYFLSHGLKSSRYNPLKFLRALVWG
jgi:glycosyltransferase involved in cell wall biosynthesis